MAGVVWEDVVALQATLSAVDPAAQMIVLAYVNQDLNPNAFGGEDSARYHIARCYLAAHLGELARRKGAQQLASKTIGTSSITLTYVAAHASADALKQTSWGAQYSEMLEQSPLRIGAGLCR